MTAAMQLWKNFFLVGYYNHRAVAPCLLQKQRTPERAVEAAERYITDSYRKHNSNANVYGVYVSACPAQWQKVGVQWESVLGPPLYSDMDRLAVGASNFLWTHVADRRGFREVECYSREQKGEGIRPPLLFPHRLMRVLHVQWKHGKDLSTLWSPAVEAIASRPTKSKRLVLARDAFVELADLCKERNAFNLSFRHGA
jgi:hypothetical protein